VGEPEDRGGVVNPDLTLLADGRAEFVLHDGSTIDLRPATDDEWERISAAQLAAVGVADELYEERRRQGLGGDGTLGLAFMPPLPFRMFTEAMWLTLNLVGSTVPPPIDELPASVGDPSLVDTLGRHWSRPSLGLPKCAAEATP
jgi:hypothetical protein